MAALKAHRALQASEKLNAGPLWQDHGLIFSSEIGTPIDPANLRRTFGRIAGRAGLDGAFPYLLRHTAVSLLLDDGRASKKWPTCSGTTPGPCTATTGTRCAPWPTSACTWNGFWLEVRHERSRGSSRATETCLYGSSQYVVVAVIQQDQVGTFMPEGQPVPSVYVGFPYSRGPLYAMGVQARMMRVLAELYYAFEDRPSLRRRLFVQALLETPCQDDTHLAA